MKINNTYTWNHTINMKINNTYTWNYTINMKTNTYIHIELHNKYEDK